MIRFRAAAARDLEADVRFYERDYPGRGVRFLGAVESALAGVEQSRERSPIEYEPDIRSAKVQRFPYRVVAWSFGMTARSSRWRIPRRQT